MTSPFLPVLTSESTIAIPTFEGPWPNDSGDLLLYIKRTYDPVNHSTTVEAQLLHVQTRAVRLLHRGSGIQSAFWAGSSDKVVLLERNDLKDCIRVIVLSNLSSWDAVAPLEEVCVLPTNATGLGAVAISSTEIVVAFSGNADPAGDVSSSEAQSNSSHSSSGRIYDGPIRVRGDVKGVQSQKLTVFCTTLKLENHRWTKSATFNPLLGMQAEYVPWGGVHMNEHGIVVIAGADLPELAEPHLTLPYFVPMPSILRQSHGERQRLQAPGLHGNSECPRISRTGTTITFLQKKEGAFEDDPYFLVVCDKAQEIATYSSFELSRSDDARVQLFPTRIEVTDDGVVIFIADDRGEKKLFRTSVSQRSNLEAVPLTEGWSVDSFHIPPKRKDSILLAGSSMTSPRRWALLHTATETFETIAEGTVESDRLGLDRIPYESIEWAGLDGVPVQAWLLKPRDFDPTKRYPLLYYIHGGPNVAINNAWATSFEHNFNLPLFADQGFVVIAPNASGSTGFGKEFAARLIDGWGTGYEDHVKGLDFIRTNLSFVDADRIIGLGFSYGAFMINWIQGQPLGRMFKAFVAEAGFINLATRYTFYLTFSVENHPGGPAHRRLRKHDKNNPIDLIEHWATPTLFINNGSDGVPVAEGIAATQVLHRKGVQTRLLTFPDEGHVVVKPENRLLWWRTVLE